eukprot:RCo034433
MQPRFVHSVSASRDAHSGPYTWRRPASLVPTRGPAEPITSSSWRLVRAPAEALSTSLLPALGCAAERSCPSFAEGASPVRGDSGERVEVAVELGWAAIPGEPQAAFSVREGVRTRMRRLLRKLLGKLI